MKWLNPILHSLLLVLAVAGIALATVSRPLVPTTGSAPPPVVVFLVRHAEKAPAPPKDPPLTAAGAARADALRDLLADTGVTHLFASEFARTQATVAPLAQQLGKEVAVVGAAKPDELLARLRALPAGAVAVVAGHSNTIPALARALANGGGTHDLAATRAAIDTVLAGTTQGNSGEQFPDDEYGRLIELVLAPPAADASAGAAPTLLRALRLHVGAR
ncbi:MAG: histidine phosphatase family protein [Planctomycetes bacterium]|nr:histidine phosphatase family protein [Planctomycetota bacterium]